LGKSDENSRKIVADKAVYTIDKNKELGYHRKDRKNTYRLEKLVEDKR
jgi:hypothetical protein